MAVVVLAYDRNRHAAVDLASSRSLACPSAGSIGAQPERIRFHDGEPWTQQELRWPMGVFRDRVCIEHRYRESTWSTVAGRSRAAGFSCLWSRFWLLLARLLARLAAKRGVLPSEIPALRRANSKIWVLQHPLARSKSTSFSVRPVSTTLRR